MTRHRSNDAAAAQADIATLAHLFQPNDVLEVRGLYPRQPKKNADGQWTPIYIGYWQAKFIDPLARKIARLTSTPDSQWGNLTSVYFTAQRLNPAVLDRSKHNFVKTFKGKPEAAKDEDVTARRYLLIDIDPVRPSEVPATENEQAAAVEVAENVLEFFEKRGWAAPAELDSGNGVHIYYRLPADENGGSLGGKPDPLQMLLSGLAAKFNTAAARIDTCVFNPSRAGRMPGTWNRKGVESDGRVHRRAGPLVIPPGWTLANPTGAVPTAELIAELCPAAARNVTAATATGPTVFQYAGTDEQLIKRATAYLAKLEPSVSGSGGHKALMRVARAVVWGFGLEQETAFDLLMTQFNPRCQPEWSEKEVRHKVDHAYTKPYSKPWGHLRDTARTGLKAKYETVGKLLPDGRYVRPRVFTDKGAEFQTNDAAAAALAADTATYQRGGMLVRVIEEPASDESAVIRRAAGSRISAVAPATLREQLSRYVNFYTTKMDDEGNLIEVDVSPPDWCVKAIHARGAWPKQRVLNSVVDHPVVLADGTILSKAGYDAGSKLFVSADITPEFPSSVSSAGDLLLEIVADFPFKAECHRAAFVASLLTPLARYAFVGASPLFLFDANTPGSGKGLLCDTVGLIVTGGNFPVTPYAHDNEEMKKQILSLALAGDRMVLFDNVDSRFGNANLCAALTATEWKGRILGVNQDACVPLFLTWYATGNNVQLCNDMPRRVVHVRLESPHERPEERAALRHPDLARWVAANRSRLLGAALHILSEYIRAGRPDQKLKPFGRFTGWSDLVRSAVVWAGLPDPLAGGDELRANVDDDSSPLGVLLEYWELFNPEGEALFLKKIVEKACLVPGPEGDELRAAMDELAPLKGGQARDVDKFGKVVRAKRRRVFVGRYIDRADAKTRSNVSARWAVFTAKDGKLVRGVVEVDVDDSLPWERTPATPPTGVTRPRPRFALFASPDACSDPNRRFLGFIPEDEDDLLYPLMLKEWRRVQECPTDDGAVTAADAPSPLSEDEASTTADGSLRPGEAYL